MATATARERINVAILASNQALFLIAAITVMTLSSLVGQRLTPNPALATLPVAMIGVKPQFEWHSPASLTALESPPRTEERSPSAALFAPPETDAR